MPQPSSTLRQRSTFEHSSNNGQTNTSGSFNAESDLSEADTDADLYEMNAPIENGSDSSSSFKSKLMLKLKRKLRRNE